MVAVYRARSYQRLLYIALCFASLPNNGSVCYTIFGRILYMWNRLFAMSFRTKSITVQENADIEPCCMPVETHKPSVLAVKTECIIERDSIGLVSSAHNGALMPHNRLMG
jgi:hypothetical protein